MACTPRSRRRCLCCGTTRARSLIWWSPPPVPPLRGWPLTLPTLSLPPHSPQPGERGLKKKRVAVAFDYPLPLLPVGGSAVGEEGRGDEGPKPRPGRQTGLNSRGSLSYHPEMSRRDPGTVRRLHGFFREYTEGLESRDFKRLFDRDAARAYAVLTREHSQVPEPKKGMRRFLFRAKLAFLGLSYKLSPPRRL